MFSFHPLTLFSFVFDFPRQPQGKHLSKQFLPTTTTRQGTPTQTQWKTDQRIHCLQTRHTTHNSLFYKSGSHQTDADWSRALRSSVSQDAITVQRRGRNIARSYTLCCCTSRWEVCKCYDWQKPVKNLGMKRKKRKMCSFHWAESGILIQIDKCDQKPQRTTSFG